MGTWLLAFTLVGMLCTLVFQCGVWWERGREGPEPCPRKHRDEL